PVAVFEDGHFCVCADLPGPAPARDLLIVVATVGNGYRLPRPVWEMQPFGGCRGATAIFNARIAR
ncbi:MAG: hypothetical protein AAF982_11200, partial [Pseudomonadota bacterium]